VAARAATTAKAKASKERNILLACSLFSPQSREAKKLGTSRVKLQILGQEPLDAAIAAGIMRPAVSEHEPVCAHQQFNAESSHLTGQVFCFFFFVST
jgi:hypothetical protein